MLDDDRIRQKINSCDLKESDNLIIFARSIAAESAQNIGDAYAPEIAKLKDQISNYKAVINSIQGVCIDVTDTYK